MKPGKSAKRISGASTASTALNPPPTKSRNDVVCEMSSRASFFPACAMRGMSTYADTSDATSANTKSGILNAA